VVQSQELRYYSSRDFTPSFNARCIYHPINRLINFARWCRTSREIPTKGDTYCDRDDDPRGECTTGCLRQL